MPQDVLNLTRGNRLRALIGWSLAASAALAVTTEFLIAGSAYEEMGIFFGIPITVISAIFAAITAYRTVQDLREKKVVWASGPLQVGITMQRYTKCQLLISTSIYEDDITIDIDCSLVEQIRSHAVVSTLQESVLRKEDRLSFRGAAQFIPHSRLLLRLAVPPGNFVYERPGLSPTSATPPA